MEFEARDNDMMNHWRMITGQVHCTICKRILPDSASYGKGKHALVDFRSRSLKILCDQCYVGLTEGITPEETERRQYIQEELQIARDNLYREAIDYRRMPRARVKTGLEDIVDPIVDQVIDHVADSIKKKVKNLGQTLWEDLSN